MEFGDFELDIVSDGVFSLDGGAMFGVVPKVLWQKLMPADELNRIKLAMNCLLIRGGKEGKNILIDTGVGDKYERQFNDKFKQRFALDRGSGLVDGLSKLGLGAGDIDYVVLSHLHFDHAGGNTIVVDGKTVPAFPNAKYIVQRKEWEDAVNPDARSKGSYLPDNFLPLEEAGNLELIDGDKEILKGVSVKVTGGHTSGHQIVMVNSCGKGAVYLADLIPTIAHIKLPYIMSYDLFPLETIKIKKEVVNHAVSNGTLCFFEHDCKVPYGYLKVKDNEAGKIEVKENKFS